MNSTPAQTVDLMSVTLKVGLPAERNGVTIYYKTLKLREVTVADERWAVRAAERVVLWDGQPKLVVSDTDYRMALVARHIERFECDGQYIDGSMIDLDLVCKLRPVDWGLIEAQVFLLELSLQLKYGEITQEAFDQVLHGTQPAPQAPQPVGPAADAGAQPAASVPGPALLADLTGQHAARPDQSVGA